MHNNAYFHFPTQTRSNTILNLSIAYYNNVSVTQLHMDEGVKLREV
jgi:hypothetical protein